MSHPKSRTYFTPTRSNQERTGMIVGRMIGFPSSFHISVNGCE